MKYNLDIDQAATKCINHLRNLFVDNHKYLKSF